MRHYAKLFLALLALAWSNAAFAEVKMHFHSFNGSVFFGRYPHTFIVLEGTLDETGQQVNENYGFTAKRTTPAILTGPVEHDILIEEEKYIGSTNRHFTVTLTDAQYREVKALKDRWKNAPGKYYDLDTRNCIHFVGEMAKIAGLKVGYPKKMLRKPKQWLNYIGTLNPELGAKPL
ncbi:hypothetical protein [Altererythrobacter sp. MTPC7]|uniref:hypothetical protein n=1 Tax=Altererythrobacter sp. MTPC7 TaxID=3056567 RepID=UPI0036F24C8E